MAEIYLAGGCFWGLEEYFSRISGVMQTSVGYANGQVETTNYQLIKETDHAETVQVVYDEKAVSLREILLYYFRVIDPLSVNQQGNDRGRQYRTGIFYEKICQKSLIELPKKLRRKLPLAMLMTKLLRKEFMSISRLVSPSSLPRISLPQAVVGQVLADLFPRNSFITTRT